jgi:hypothetical protein
MILLRLFCESLSRMIFLGRLTKTWWVNADRPCLKSLKAAHLIHTGL